MSENHHPLVSVIMNCFNCERYLKEAINSVYAQTYGNWEIVFWDNGSTDRSSEIAQKYDDKIQYYRGDETISLGAARNEALKRAQGEFIAFLDCDDLWMPEKLALQIPMFAEPDVGLVFSDAIYFNERGKSNRLYHRRTYSTGWAFVALISDYFICLQTVVIRRTALQGLQEWVDPRFNAIEEVDLFCRIAHDWKIAMVDEPLAKWRVHSASLTWTKPHLFAEEFSLMLEKYQELFLEFNNASAKEVRILKQQTDILRALDSLKAGQKQRARKCLYPYIFSSVKVLTLVLLSCLPTNIFSFIYNRRRSAIEPY